MKSVYCYDYNRIERIPRAFKIQSLNPDYGVRTNLLIVVLARFIGVLTQHC